MTPEQEKALAIADATLKLNQPQPSTLSDVAQSIPQYGETAATSLVGMPGDVANLASKGISYLGGPQMPHYAGSADLQQKLNELQGGPLYQPQTTAGQAGNVAAGLLPAVLGGPENVAAKLATRVFAPAAVITGIQNTTAIPEAAKPYAEAATVLFAPFAANRLISPALKRLGVGVLPTMDQMKATNGELSRIYQSATDPAEKAQALAAWREVARRYHNMQLINGTIGGGATSLPQRTISARLGKLNEEVQTGAHGDTFTPQEAAQLDRAAATEVGGVGPTIAKAATDPYTHMISIPGAVAITNHIINGSPSLEHLIMAGSASAIAFAIKVAYPHLGGSQINRLIETVKRGAKVIGAPNYTPQSGGYSPLAPALATTPLADQGNQ